MKQGLSARLTPEDILAPHSASIGALARRQREVVRSAVPSASEHAYPVWRAIGYRHPRAGYFCAIFPYEHHVKAAGRRG